MAVRDGDRRVLRISFFTLKPRSRSPLTLQCQKKEPFSDSQRICKQKSKRVDRKQVFSSNRRGVPFVVRFNDETLYMCIFKREYQLHLRWTQYSRVFYKRVDKDGSQSFSKRTWICYRCGNEIEPQYRCPNRFLSKLLFPFIIKDKKEKSNILFSFSL